VEVFACLRKKTRSFANVHCVPITRKKQSTGLFFPGPSEIDRVLALCSRGNPFIQRGEALEGHRHRKKEERMDESLLKKDEYRSRHRPERDKRSASDRERGGIGTGGGGKRIRGLTKGWREWWICQSGDEFLNARRPYTSRRRGDMGEKGLGESQTS